MLVAGLQNSSWFWPHSQHCYWQQGLQTHIPRRSIHDRALVGADLQVGIWNFLSVKPRFSPMSIWTRTTVYRYSQKIYLCVETYTQGRWCLISFSLIIGMLVFNIFTTYAPQTFFPLCFTAVVLSCQLVFYCNNFYLKFICVFQASSVIDLCYLQSQKARWVQPPTHSFITEKGEEEECLPNEKGMAKINVLLDYIFLI